MAKELKYLKKVLTGFMKDVKSIYTTMWELDKAFQLPRTDGYNEHTAEGGKCRAKR